MKRYIHPDFNLPAGKVSVVFFDDSKSGDDVLLPNIIESIGDVEEGYDYAIGDYYSPDCSFRIRQCPEAREMFDTLSLRVLTTLDDSDLYFYGFVSMDTLSPSILEIGESRYGHYEFEAIGILSLLKKMTLWDVYSNSENYTIGAIYAALADFVFASGVDWDVERKYQWEDTDGNIYDAFLDSVEIEDIALHTTARENYYAQRLENAFDMLAEQAREFFFFPVLYFTGNELRLSIMEKDVSRLIELPPFSDKRSFVKYAIDSMSSYLENTPDGMDLSGLEYYSENPNPFVGEKLELPMHHTNILRTYGDGYRTSIIIRVKYSADYEMIDHISKNGATYDSFTEAIHNAYKNVYFGKFDWKRADLYGLKATRNGVSSGRFLAPGYNCFIDGDDYKILTVRKSLKKNESRIEAVRV